MENTVTTPAPSTANANPGSPMAFSEGQLRSMADRLIENGIDPAAVHAALKADGYSPPAPDQRSPQQLEHDRAYGFDQGAWKPSDYHLTFNQEQLQQSPEVLAEAHALGTELLATWNLPPALGNSLLSHIAEVAATVGRMDEVSERLWRAEQDAYLRRFAGSPEAEKEIIANVMAMIRLAADGSDRVAAIAEQFVKGPAFRSAWVVKTLSNFGKHRQEWQADRPKN